MVTNWFSETFTEESFHRCPPAYMGWTFSVMYKDAQGRIGQSLHISEHSAVLRAMQYAKSDLNSITVWNHVTQTQVVLPQDLATACKNYLVRAVAENVEGNQQAHLFDMLRTAKELALTLHGINSTAFSVYWNGWTFQTSEATEAFNVTRQTYLLPH